MEDSIDHPCAPLFWRDGTELGAYLLVLFWIYSTCVNSKMIAVVLYGGEQAFILVLPALSALVPVQGC
jgi:hypothetical protein